MPFSALDLRLHSLTVDRMGELADKGRFRADALPSLAAAEAQLLGVPVRAILRERKDGGYDVVGDGAPAMAGLLAFYRQGMPLPEDSAFAPGAGKRFDDLPLRFQNLFEDHMIEFVVISVNVQDADLPTVVAVVQAGGYR